MLDLDAIEAVLTAYARPDSTHYEDCYKSHPMCAAWAMLHVLRERTVTSPTSDEAERDGSH